MDTWTVYASSGEYPIEAENVGHAYLRFTAAHHDDFVLAIVCDAMQPMLIVENGEPDDLRIPVGHTQESVLWVALVADLLQANHGATDYDAAADYAASLLDRYPDLQVIADKATSTDSEASRAWLADAVRIAVARDEANGGE